MNGARIFVKRFSEKAGLSDDLRRGETLRYIKIIQKRSDTFAGGNADDDNWEPLGEADAAGKNRKHVSYFCESKNPAPEKEAGKNAENSQEGETQRNGKTEQAVKVSENNPQKSSILI